MGNWLSRSMAEQQSEQDEDSGHEQSQEAAAEIAADRRLRDETYQRLITRLAAERAAQREQTEQRRRAAMVQAEAVLKAEARLAYSGSAASFEHDWQTLHAEILATAERRQHAIDRACGPYFLSDRGLVPHRHQPAREYNG